MHTPKHYEEVAHSYYEWMAYIINVDEQEGTDGFKKSYWHLIRDLYRKEFYWTVDHDDNRVGDVSSLREAYMENIGYDVIGLLDHSVSVFEVLLSISYRIAHITDDLTDNSTAEHACEWFWHLVRNLDLWQYNDDEYVEKGTHTKVLQIIDKLLDRTYEPDGCGGLFPLLHPDKDQRTVEIWYQMQAYINENFYSN